MAVKRSGPRAPRLERLKVAPSNSSRFSLPAQGPLHGLTAAARQLDDPDSVDVV